MSNEKNGGELLVDTLLSRGVENVFFVPGGTYTTVLEALSRNAGRIRAVATRLESSAAFAADACAALTRRPTCVFVSRAPGACNASIGVHNAMQASRPVVLVIANIPRAQKQREAFQEIDYALMYRPIAKAVFDVEGIDSLPAVAARALDLAMSGRPGPVVVSVSRDILDAVPAPDRAPAIPAPSVRAPGAAPERLILDLAARLAGARRPLVIAGEMVAFERAHAGLVRLADACGAGVVAAYRQQDVFPNRHPAWAGHLTLNRVAHTERALDEADLVLAVGTRLDSVTTDNYRFRRPGQTLVMVYPDDRPMAQWQPDLAVQAHAAPFLEALAAAVEGGRPPAQRLAWRDAINAEERSFADPTGIEAAGAINMARVIEHFAATVPAETIVTSDAGTFGRWLHRYHVLATSDSSLGPVSGSMGYGVPAAIGASVAAPGRPVFAFVGDGGFLMTGQEVAAAVQEKLPIKVVVCDNRAWGSILVNQHRRFPGWEFGTRLESPDFAALAAGYGMGAFRVEETAGFPAALAGALAHDGPALVHLLLDARDVSPFDGPGGG